MRDIKDTILVLDDEPMFLDWVEDFLHTKGYKTKFVTNIRDALNEVSVNRYRCLVVDLDVPASAELRQMLEEKGPVFTRYRGLVVAEKARNSGYRDKQVVVYSVHAVPAVKEITDRLRVAYLSKGRPHIFLGELESILEYDPTENPAE